MNRGRSQPSYARGPSGTRDMVGGLKRVLANVVPSPWKRPKEPARPRLERKLGEGGMGAVYLAATPTGERVVVKVPRIDGAIVAPERCRARLQEEGALFALMDAHPNVLRCLGAYVLDDEYHLMLEHIDGHTFEQARDLHEMTDERVADWMEQLLLGVAHIHASGIIHRAIQPRNVMLEATGRVVVIDLGTSKRIGDRAGHTRLFSGGYMPPEITAHGSLHVTGDVFSCGATMYYLMTGKHLDDPYKLGDRCRDELLAAGWHPRLVETVVMATHEFSPMRFRDVLRMREHLLQASAPDALTAGNRK